MEHRVRNFVVDIDERSSVRDFDRSRPCSLGCKAPVPAALSMEGFCIVHFTLNVEEACAELRRETAASTSSAARHAEIAEYVSDIAVKLSRAANENLGLSDETKRRILATFLTLMNLRENLDRAEKRFVAQLETVTC